MTSCVCDGTEDYDCPSILDNMNKLCRLKPYVSTTTESLRTTTTQRTTLITTPYHSQEIAVGGGSGVAGRKNSTKKNEPDQVGDVTQPTGQLPRHPPTKAPEACGQTNAHIRNCSQSANEEDNEATVTLHPVSVGDRNSGTAILINLPLLISSFTVWGFFSSVRISS